MQAARTQNPKLVFAGDCHGCEGGAGRADAKLAEHAITPAVGSPVLSDAAGEVAARGQGFEGETAEDEHRLSPVFDRHSTKLTATRTTPAVCIAVCRDATGMFGAGHQGSEGELAGYERRLGPVIG